MNLPRASSMYGASMGRPDIEKTDTVDRMSLRRIRLDRGGYDSGGAYWGRGQPLYWAGSDCGLVDLFFRARDRQDAKAQVQSRYPTARFFR